MNHTLQHTLFGGMKRGIPIQILQAILVQKKATKAGSDPYTIYCDIFPYGSCHWDTVSMIHKYSSYAFKPIHVPP